MWFALALISSYLFLINVLEMRLHCNQDDCTENCIKQCASEIEMFSSMGLFIEVVMTRESDTYADMWLKDRWARVSHTLQKFQNIWLPKSEESNLGWNSNLTDFGSLSLVRNFSVRLAWIWLFWRRFSDTLTSHFCRKYSAKDIFLLKRESTGLDNTLNLKLKLIRGGN